MPKMLSDKCELRGYGAAVAYWEKFKKFAMKSKKPRLEDEHWFSSYDE